VNFLNNYYFILKNTENPDGGSQRTGPKGYIDLFLIKPNKHGLWEKSSALTVIKTQLSNKDLIISQSGTKAARALHLLVSSHKKVAGKHQTPSI